MSGYVTRALAKWRGTAAKNVIGYRVGALSGGAHFVSRVALENLAAALDPLVDAEVEGLRAERDRLAADVHMFEEAVCFPDGHRLAVEDGNVLRAIQPTKVAELVRERDRLRRYVCENQDNGEYVMVRLFLSKDESRRVAFATEDWIVEKIRAALAQPEEESDAE